MKKQNKISRYVNLQCFLLYLCIFTFICIGCGSGGGGGSNTDADQGEELNAILISPKAAMLTKSGQTEQLTSTVYDNDGNEMSVGLEWSSSNPDAVSVDDNGLVTTLADIGSALITASSKGVESNKVMIIIANPVADALMVSDDQIVDDISPEDPNAEFDLGFRYITKLSGMAPPEVGAIILGTGEKPLGGKVVTVVQNGDEVEVVFETVAIGELFADLVIDEEIDLSREVPTLAKMFADNYDVTWQPDGTLEFTLKEQVIAASANSDRSGIGMSTLDLNPNANHGPFTCEAGFTNPLVLDAFPASLSADYSNLTLDIDYQFFNGGLQHILLKGDLKGTFEVSNTLSVALQGKVGCKTKLAEIPIPFPGVLGAYLSFFIPLGVGFEVDGKITLAQVGFKFKAEAMADVEMGWQCSGGPDCDFVTNLDPTASAKMEGISPDWTGTLAALSQFRLEPSLSGFVFSGLEIGPPSLTPGAPSALPVSPRVNIAQLQAGLKQTGNFAIVEAQMDDESYSSDYAVSLEGTMEAVLSSNYLGRVMQVNLLSRKFPISVSLAKSPQVLSAVADTLAFQQGDKVKFTINLDPSNITYPMYGYNPLFQYNPFRIRIYRKADDGFGGIGPADLIGEKVLDNVQTQVEIEWTADSDGTIDGSYFAFINTKAWPFPYFGELEVAEIQPPPPLVTTEILMGTATAYCDLHYGDPDGSFSDYPSVTWGTLLEETGDCEYNGGQTGSVSVNENWEYGNILSANASLIATGSSNSATATFSATATSVLTKPADKYRAEANINGSAVTDNGQFKIIVDNQSPNPVDLVVSWSCTPVIEVSGGICSAKGSCNFRIPGYLSITPMKRQSCGASPVSDGPFSGSEYIEIIPGKHCLDLIVGAGTEADSYVDPQDPDSSANAQVSGSVSVSVQ